MKKSFRYRWLGCLALAALLILAGGISVATSSTGADKAQRLGEHRLVSKVGPSDGTMGAAAAQAMRQGYLVPDQAAYDRAKAEAAAAPGKPAEVESASGLRAPVVTRGWDGIFDPKSAPSDSTSSVGSTRYIEVVNSKFALYNKTSNAPVGTGTLNDLAAGSGKAFDPQIMWDAQTNRFYYAMDLVVSSSANTLAIGFSKTASPNTAADFCHYFIPFGPAFPDYPKLGDTSKFWLVGSNVFDSLGAFLGSDVVGLSKPAAGTTCPDPSTFKLGEFFDLRDPNGGPAFTPVVVNQIDPSSTGYVIARTGGLPSTRFSLHRITVSGTGTPVIQNPGLAVVVPSYAIPPQAPQRSGFPSSTKKLDTMDARPTQAVSAVDPGHANAVGLWVQHTTAGGAGSEVRWYEINPVTRTLFQKGKATSASLFEFNGAISPNRRRQGATVSGGNSMVLGFDTSSTTSFPAVRMVSKVGTGAQSGQVLVHSSPVNYSGFDCAGTDNSCRWGDYAGASPDPATANRIWLVSQYASGTSTTGANWRTWNWVATP